MLCRSVTGKRMLLSGAAVLLAVGLSRFLSAPEAGGVSALLLGVFTLYRVRFAPQKLKEEEINRRDERNIQVTRASYAVSNSAAALLFGFMAFILVLLNYITPALIAVGALCIQALVSVIAYRVFNKRM